MIAVAVVAFLTVVLQWIDETADDWGSNPAFPFVYAAFLVLFVSAPYLARVLDRWQRGA